MCFIDEKCYVSDPESDAIIKELQRMMDKVEEMKNQRAMLEDQFRNQIKNDDITNQIVAQDGGSNTLVRDSYSHVRGRCTHDHMAIWFKSTYGHCNHHHIVLACLTSWLDFRNIFSSPRWLISAWELPPISFWQLLTMEINNLNIFLMFWWREKQILLLLPMDYDISLLLIVKFSNFTISNGEIS